MSFTHQTVVFIFFPTFEHQFCMHKFNTWWCCKTRKKRSGTGKSPVKLIHGKFKKTTFSSNEFKDFFANKQTLDKNTHLNKTTGRCFTKFWLTIQKFNNLPYYFVFQSVRKFQCLIESREPHVKSYKNIFQFMVDPRNLLEIFLILHFEKLMCHIPAKPPRNVFLKKWLCHKPANHPGKFFCFAFWKINVS